MSRFRTQFLCVRQENDGRPRSGPAFARYQQDLAPVTLSEPDVILYATWISIWGRWFVWLVVVFMLAYRPAFCYPDRVEAVALPILQLLVNGLIHYRLLKRRPITQSLSVAAQRHRRGPDRVRRSMSSADTRPSPSLPSIRALGPVRRTVPVAMGHACLDVNGDADLRRCLPLDRWWNRSWAWVRRRC